MTEPHRNDSIAATISEHSQLDPASMTRFLVNVGSEDDPFWVRAELLWIEPDQPVRGLLRTAQTAKMIRGARKLPEDNRQFIVKTAQPQISFSSLNNDFGMAIEKKLLNIEAHILLHQPYVSYGPSYLADDILEAGQWKLEKQISAKKVEDAASTAKYCIVLHVRRHRFGRDLLPQDELEERIGEVAKGLFGEDGTLSMISAEFHSMRSLRSTDLNVGCSRGTRSSGPIRIFS